MIKTKPCKGQGKAVNFNGCGTVLPVNYRKYGLCPNCLKDFYLSTEEGAEIMQKATIKAKAVVKKKVKKKAVDEKQKLRREVTDWKKKLQAEVNKIVRLIDKGLPCLATGRYPNQMHAGHIYSRGAEQTIRFNLHNIHRQSAQSNHFQSDDVLMREKLVEEYGLDYMEFITSLRSTPPLNLSNKEYYELYKKALDVRKSLEAQMNLFSDMRNKAIDEPLERIRLRNNINIQLGIYDRKYCLF